MPRSQLVDHPFGVEAFEHHRREHAVHHLGGVEVALDRVVHPRILHLHGHVDPGRRDGLVHLTDACRGDRQVAPVEERALGRHAELALDHARCERRCHRGRVCLQRGECGLGLVGQRLEDERDQLAGLHEDALHLAELLGDVLSGANRELLVELGPAFGGGSRAAHLHHGEPCRVARRQLPHLRGAAEPAGQRRLGRGVARLGRRRRQAGSERHQGGERGDLRRLLHGRLTDCGGRRGRRRAAPRRAAHR